MISIRLHSFRYVVRHSPWWLWPLRVVLVSLMRLNRKAYHVTVADDRGVYDASIFGCEYMPHDVYPIKMSGYLTLTDAKLTMTPNQWRRRKITPARALLDALAFPRLWRVDSCVTLAAELLGVSQRCRYGTDLFRAALAGDYCHEQSLQDPQGERRDTTGSTPV